MQEKIDEAWNLKFLEMQKKGFQLVMVRLFRFVWKQDEYRDTCNMFEEILGKGTES